MIETCMYNIIHKKKLILKGTNATKKLEAAHCGFRELPIIYKDDRNGRLLMHNLPHYVSPPLCPGSHYCCGDH